MSSAHIITLTGGLLKTEYLNIQQRKKNHSFSGWSLWLFPKSFFYFFNAKHCMRQRFVLPCECQWKFALGYALIKCLCGVRGQFKWADSLSGPLPFRSFLTDSALTWLCVCVFLFQFSFPLFFPRFCLLSCCNSPLVLKLCPFFSFFFYIFVAIPHPWPGCGAHTLGLCWT